MEALSRLRDFIEDYAAARERLRAGEEGVLFPEGTYWFRVNKLAVCSTS
jgi:hypothetical protein